MNYYNIFKYIIIYNIMSLIIYENAIYLPPYNLGVIIKNVDNNTIDKNIKWVSGDLHAYDLTKKKNYKVLIHRIDSKNVLVKPIKPYYCYVFEYIFDFGYKCDEFSQNKIISISSN